MLNFYDARCFVGTRGNIPPGAAASTAETLAQLSRCGISSAVCCHSAALEGDPMMGNSLLESELPAAPHFARQWVMAPACLGDFPETEALLPMMKASGVKSLRLIPQTLGHSLRPYAIKKLMGALEECHVPLFLDLAETSWEQLYTFCTDFPGCTVVLTEPGYRGIRFIDPLLESCKNLRIGTSNLVAFQALERLCRKHGAERFLFESGAPLYSAAAAVSLITYSGLSGEEKSFVAGENLRILLEEVAL